SVLDVRPLDLEHPDETVVVDGVGDIAFPELELDRSRASGFQRFLGLEDLLALLGQLIALTDQVVQNQTTAQLLARLDTNRVRGWNRVDAGSRASNDDLVFLQRNRPALRIEYEDLERVLAGLRKAQLHRRTIL